MRMAIDKELFDASHGLIYLARPNTDDMVVKEKVFTKAGIVAMLTEIQLEIHELWDNDPSYIEGVYDAEKIIQQKINELKAESEGKE